MKAIEFDGANAILGAGQPEVNPLPVHRAADQEGTITSCYELDENERKAVAASGKIWLQVWTYGMPLQPQRLSICNPLDEPAVTDQDRQEQESAANSMGEFARRQLEGPPS